jgi:hypothetical protein
MRITLRAAAGVVVIALAVAALTAAPASAGGACTATGCALTQTLGVSVLPGPLTAKVTTIGANPSRDTARLVRPRGHDDGILTGQLNRVTVTDARGGTTGWTLTASVSNFSDGWHTIPNANLRTTPYCGAVTRDSAPGVHAGPPVRHSGSVMTLCTKDGTVGAYGSTGGTYAVGADLALSVPRRSADQYTAIVTLQLS